MVACSFATPANAGLLWYNGDYDSRTSLLNETNVPATNTTNPAPPVQTSLVYDNFVVPVGQTWTLSSVFTNDFVDYAIAPKTATWQILSGVGAGNGGKVVASGDTAATLTPLSGISLSGGFTAETVTAAVTTPVVLTAGTYWLAVAPDSAGGEYGDSAYAMTTSGANSVGSPAGNDGNSFITNTYPPTGSTGSYYFTPTTTVLNKRGTNYGSDIDFSMGVNGIVSLTVPEPTSVVMVLIGLGGSVGSLAWAKRRRATPAG